MKLLDYLNNLAETKELTYRETLKLVAKKANSTPLYLDRLAKGWQAPGPQISIRLEKVTGGAVARGDLRPDLWP